MIPNTNIFSDGAMCSAPQEDVFLWLVALIDFYDNVTAQLSEEVRRATISGDNEKVRFYYLLYGEYRTAKTVVLSRVNEMSLSQRMNYGNVYEN